MACFSMARLVAADYPRIEFDDCIVDAAAMKLVLDPHQFDVLVMENLFGDIISDLGQRIGGRARLDAQRQPGTDLGVFEAVHGTAPDIAGKGLANPTAVILSSASMLHWLGEVAAAEKIERAVYSVLGEGKITTGDLGGLASTEQYANGADRRNRSSIADRPSISQVVRRCLYKLVQTGDYKPGTATLR